MKQIVFTGVGKAELCDEPLRNINENEVLVKTAFSTISNGTERANLMGEPNVNGASNEKIAPFPKRLGYSSSGVVAAVGGNVTKFKPGDRVSGAWGVHAQYNIYDESALVMIPDEIGLDEASIAHIATFPLAALRKVRIEIGESAIVMGLGILGIIGVQLLKAAGAVPIIAADPNKARRELALKLGADYALDPTVEGFAERVKELTEGGANAAIEVTGIGAGLDEVLDCMARFGRVALLGCTRNPDFTIDYYKKIHCPGITLIGAHTNARPAVESHAGYWTHNDDRKALFKLICGKRLDLASLISEVHSPNEAGEVFARLAYDKDFPFGVQFDWSALND